MQAEDATINFWYLCADNRWRAGNDVLGHPPVAGRSGNAIMELANGLWLDLRWFWLAIVLATLFLLGMAALAFRFGPKRGRGWNQPAARYVAPGRSLMIALWCVALLHVIGGIAASTSSDIGPSVVVVAAAMGLFYVACAHSMRLASRAGRAMDRRHHERHERELS